MKRPIIFSIDDDEQVLQAIYRDLRSKYRKEYRVMSTSSANEALESLPELKNKGENVALFLSDQRMPEMQGVDFLEKAKKLFPEAKRVLLTAYSEIDTAIKAINDVQLDYYLTKPWDPPEEKLYPVVDDLLQQWHHDFIPDYEGIKILGYQYSPDSHKLKEFLSGNLVPYKWMDVDTDEKAKELISLNTLCDNDYPVIFYEDGNYDKKPSLQDVATKIGMNPNASSELYDVVIIGAGPAGLAASVYGSSEGLKTLLIERKAPGGQAGTSSRIENYLGFPTGVSGSDLTRRAVTQATRLGAEILSPQEVQSVELKDQYKILTLGDGKKVNTKSVVITTGVSYKQHPAVNIENFTGAGVYYGAANTEAAACKEKDVYIVGGGNSAGQAAMYLSKFARNVYILIRKPDLTSSMSAYLIDQIDDTENIHVKGYSEITEVNGSDRLEKIKIRNKQTDKIEEVDAGALFIFIGAKPVTDWLSGSLLTNEKGYLKTGKELSADNTFGKIWKTPREPFLLETCVPGIFAAGDVRSGAMNRVASAVGEGAMSIKFVHEYLAEV